MNDPENFLTRWSRRKREEAAEPDRASDEKDVQGGSEATAAEQSAGDAPPLPATGDNPAEPEFDLSTLPPIETIVAETDIRAFLRPGVPAELRLAALRRAWVADPKVRDFVGLNDYDFDFHTPGAIPGFGALEMTDELRQEVARMISGWQPEPEQAVARSADETASEPAPTVSPVQPAVSTVETSAPSARGTLEVDKGADQVAPPQDELMTDKAKAQRNKDYAAAQQQHSESENLQKLARRGHGRALPK
ncbi:MAG: DUF3306 domain-containing protein [Xanthobacteraceae bacterium]|nr:DUF3306 domain-containing protein [Xanthobacteraceae bacterium]